MRTIVSILLLVLALTTFGSEAGAQSPMAAGPQTDDKHEHEHDFPEPYDTESETTSPMSAEEAAATAVLPPGFRCEVFASEPDVRQPIAMCFDERGRLWVAECYTYAEPPQQWAGDLRDRIIILEDTNGDGRADKRDVFWDQGTQLTSIAKVEGGIYALCPPNLLFLPDADGDDVPDAAPEIVLDGFEVATTSHNVANGLKVGPDGWLYGRHGILSVSLVGTPSTPDALRSKVNTSIWRFHPQTKAFEVFCDGGTNPWGLDWDANGQLFYTNTVIGHLWHGLPGAYYERMFGASLNPFVYEVIGHTADHYHWDTGEKWSDTRNGMSSRTSELGGGHAHMGCLIYKSGVWPAEYAGNLFTSNFHGRRINRDILKRTGCGYVAHHGEDFLLMKDPFFRGLDVIAGPDGQMWINDWSDTGECHDHTGLHRSSGRIYRIVYDGPDKGERKSDFDDWLTQRAAASFDQAKIDSLLKSGDEGRRAMGVRFLCEDFGQDTDTIQTLIAIAENDSSGLVRVEVAAGLQRLPVKDRMRVASVLCQHSQDAEDRQQPHMIWYGIEAAVAVYPEQAVELAAASRIAKIREWISRRFAESLDENPAAVEQILNLVTAAPTGSSMPEILHGIEAGLRGRSRAKPPANWDAVVAGVEQAGVDDEISLVRELSLVFGDGRARESLVSLAFDPTADASARRSAVKTLMRQPSDDLLPRLFAAVNDTIIAGEVVRALAHYEGPEVSMRLIDRWKRSPLDRDAAIDSLVVRKQHAHALLTAVANGTIPATAISPYQARQIHHHGDAELSAKLEELWGSVRESPEVKTQELERWKNLLTTERIEAANVVAGKAIFLKQCAACHQLYNDGHTVGPNLTGGDRHNLDYLLSNMVDPSAVVAAAYRMSVLLLEDGRVLSGVVSSENENSLTLQTQQQTEQVDKALIVERNVSDVSLMPDGILTQMSEAEVADLVSYLMTSGPIDTLTP